MTAASTETRLRSSSVHLGDVEMTRAMLTTYEKRGFLSEAESAGIPVPLDVDPEAHLRSGGAVFFKEAHERGGGARGIARTTKDLPQVDRSRMLFQEYIQTAGTYGVAFVASDGRVLESVPHWESLSFPVVGGSAITLERVRSDRLEDLTARLVSHFELSGWGLAEFKLSDRGDDFALMEVNGKFWASVEFSMRAEGRMFERLFGVKHRLPPVSRMTYVHRAVSRASGGSVRDSLSELRRPDTVHVRYPNLMRSVASGVKHAWVQ